MDTITKFLSFLAICLILLPHDHQTLAHDNPENDLLKNIAFPQGTKAKDLINTMLIPQGTRGKELITKICEQLPNKDDCTRVLSSDPRSSFASLKDLAMISLNVAAANASGILNDVKMMIDDADLDPGIQQGLADCKETLLDAEGQLEDTIAALLANAKHDAQVWLQAALAAIDTCDDSIPGDDDILSKRSVAFRQLCNIPVAISKALADSDDDDDDVKKKA